MTHTQSTHLTILVKFLFSPLFGRIRDTIINRVWAQNLLIIGLLSLTLSTRAQTNWTQHDQTRPIQYLADVAYGAGRYVAVGFEGMIRVSTDGVAWKTQVAGSPSASILLGIIYANGQFVAVGSSGCVLTSGDGLTWVKRVSGTSSNLYNIAYGGGLFMAVGGVGGVSTAIISANGINWTTCTTGTTANFHDVSYANGLFVAVGEYGIIKTTPNGTAWTERSLVTGSNLNLRAVTAGSNGSFVAVGINNMILTSIDGKTWQDHSSYPYYYTAMQYTDVSYNPVNGQYVAIGGGVKSFNLATSSNGLDWTLRAAETIYSSDYVRCINGQFISVGIQGNVNLSSDGLNWKSPLITKELNLYGAAYGNGRYVAVGEYPSEENRSLRSNVALTSWDGQHYGIGETIHLPGGAKCFYDVAFGVGLFVTVGEDAIIQTSVDGKVWSYSSVNFGQTLRGITYGGGWFIAIGDKGFLCRSVDGKTWVPGNVGKSSQYNSITYANGLFVAVGEFGAIATSPNGLLWTVRNSGTTKQIKSVAYGAGMWVAVGYDGLVCWSLDGGNWYNYITDPTARFNHVVYVNGQFVAVSLDGKLYTAPTAFGWTARQSTVSAHLYGLTHGPGQFVAVGVATTVITSTDDREGTSGRGRQGVVQPEVSLQAVSYPNPVEQAFTVDIDGASGQDVRLWLVDLQGRTILDRQIKVGESQHRESISLEQQQTGTYLLQVSTAEQSRTLKVLKR